MTTASDVPKPETRLQCAPGLRLQCEGDGRVAIEVGETVVWRGGTEGLEILAMFGRPTTFAAGLKPLAARAASPADWVRRVETVRRLVACGVLVESAERAPQVHAVAPAFGGAPVHIRMLNDRVRTAQMMAAIRAEVRSGDVVVEVGTGTGVLAVAAVQAGARHVYAIEAGAMAPVARELVRANGVAERVTIVEGWSQAISLPERGDVFVSETIGNAGFDEHLVAIARDALERLLKPGARMIPRRLRLRALPVEASSEWLSGRLFQAGTAARWREWYGIDFAILPRLPLALDPRLGTLPIRSEETKNLGAAFDLAAAEFFPGWRAQLSGTSRVALTAAGEWNALRLFFEAELSPGISLSTNPSLSMEERPDSWANPLWAVPVQSVEAGQSWQIDFAWRPRGRHQLAVRPLATAT